MHCKDQQSRILFPTHQQSLVSIVDRKTGYLWLKKCSTRKSQDVREVTVDLLDPIKELRCEFYRYSLFRINRPELSHLDG